MESWSLRAEIQTQTSLLHSPVDEATFPKTIIFICELIVHIKLTNTGRNTTSLRYKVKVLVALTHVGKFSHT